MSSLIRRISGSQMVLRLASGQLPDSLKSLITHVDEQVDGNHFTLRVNEVNEVEPILAALRASGAVIEDMQLQQADLEDVFLQIMETGK